MVIKDAKRGGKMYTVDRIKMADKLKALELGAKILKMLIAKPESEGNWEELAARLASAR